MSGVTEAPTPVALVSGAGTGIGRASALELGRSGHAVMACGRTEQPLDETVSLLRDAGVAANRHLCDVTDAAEVKDLVAATTERFGPGWVDRRSAFATFMDPFDFAGALKGNSNVDAFWNRPEEWPVTTDGSFALGTASNVAGKQRPQEPVALKEAPSP